jgi:hypothetical protein
LELSVTDKEEILKLLHEKKRGFQLIVKTEKEKEIGTEPIRDDQNLSQVDPVNAEQVSLLEEEQNGSENEDDEESE